MCRLIGLVGKISEAVTRTLRRAACRVADLIRRTWRDHLDQVANNAAYSAAAGAVVGGVLGFIPARDVIAAILAAVLHLCVAGARHGAGSTTRIVDPWELD